MSNQITEAHVSVFSSNVLMNAQQKMSRLRVGVNENFRSDGKRVYFDRLGTVEVQTITSRHADTPRTDTPHARRMLTTIQQVYSDLIDGADRVRVIQDPQSNYVQAGTAAYNRAIDDRIIAALGGTSYSGEDGSTPVTFPTAQKVDEAGSVGLTIDKLIQARELLDAAEAEDDERYFVCSSKQISNLLSTVEVTSADYNTVQALVRGEVDTFLGFKFLKSERLLTSSSKRLCYAWQKNGVGYGMPIQPEVKVSDRPDKNHATQVWVSIMHGATRIDEDRVVQVVCAES